jgi:hemerythrin-like domain-containing protein
MGALDPLRHEHEVILDAVALMERTLEPQTGDLDPAACESVVVFLREYADRHHHANEEQVLFPVMRRDPLLAGLADMLENEHAEGRVLLAAIERAMRERVPDRLRRAVLEYAAFMRQHIAKEDEMVFAVTERELGADQAEELRLGFASHARTTSL